MLTVNQNTTHREMKKTCIPLISSPDRRIEGAHIFNVRHRRGSWFSSRAIRPQVGATFGSRRRRHAKLHALPVPALCDKAFVQRAIRGEAMIWIIRETQIAAK